VPVAYEIARALEAPLDLWSTRRVLSPDGRRTLGAVSLGGTLSLHRRALLMEEISADALDAQVRAAAHQVGEEDAKLRGGRAPQQVEGQTVVLVDDGCQTGETARAGLDALRTAGAGPIILALGAAPSAVLAALEQEADAVVCGATSEVPGAVGAFYEDYPQVDDDQVRELCARAALRPDAATMREGQAVRIPIPGGALEGELVLPKDPVGLVLFAHGSGSSRKSPRNRQVAATLQRHGLGTLLFDLLTEDEAREDAQTGALRFDVERLAGRLRVATAWTAREPKTARLALGYFGSSTGAAAALMASVDEPRVRAVVSRGGRPDLAMERLQQVDAPTLLLVGGEDPEVLALNRRAYERLWAPRQLLVIPRATHLFEEPGTLEQVAALACDWFVRFLPIGLTAEQTDSWA
jgi:putative phosphoribosyl transferase